MPPDLYWSNFSVNFWSNFLADLLVGGVIVLFIQLIISYNEKRQIEFGERKKKELKAIGYLKSILSEVELNTNLASTYLKTDDFSKDLNLFSTLWDSFMVTGELPSILGENVFGSLSFYYSHIQKAKRIDSLIFETRLFKNSYLEENLKKVLKNYLQVLERAEEKYGLIEMIKTFKKSSELELENINIEIRKTNLLYRIQDFFINEGLPKDESY